MRKYSGTSCTAIVLEQFGAVAATRMTTSLIAVAGNDVFQYDIALATPVNLSAGTDDLLVQNLGISGWPWLENSPGNSSGPEASIDSRSAAAGA